MAKASLLSPVGQSCSRPHGGLHALTGSPPCPSDPSLTAQSLGSFQGAPHSLNPKGSVPTSTWTAHPPPGCILTFEPHLLIPLLNFHHHKRPHSWAWPLAAGREKQEPGPAHQSSPSTEAQLP